eukprot:TRINITY_DN68880_c0_g1_i1.p1 TRINITY_DN68880_c0_g1~~TRINITY_DN68880_c0_g1_i1.p1  ORF type:complete len:686 (-),score=97.28 TRINITY_DN68880_c0_g1_i1:33-2090(-)
MARFWEASTIDVVLRDRIRDVENLVAQEQRNTAQYRDEVEDLRLKILQQNQQIGNLQAQLALHEELLSEDHQSAQMVYSRLSEEFSSRTRPLLMKIDQLNRENRAFRDQNSALSLRCSALLEREGQTLSLRARYMTCLQNLFREVKILRSNNQELRNDIERQSVEWKDYVKAQAITASAAITASSSKPTTTRRRTPSSPLVLSLEMSRSSTTNSRIGKRAFIASEVVSPRNVSLRVDSLSSNSLLVPPSPINAQPDLLTFEAEAASATSLLDAVESGKTLTVDQVRHMAIKYGMLLGQCVPAAEGITRRPVVSTGSQTETIDDKGKGTSRLGTALTEDLRARTASERKDRAAAKYRKREPREDVGLTTDVFGANRSLYDADDLTHPLTNGRVSRSSKRKPPTATNWKEYLAVMNSTFALLPFRTNSPEGREISTAGTSKRTTVPPSRTSSPEKRQVTEQPATRKNKDVLLMVLQSKLGVPAETGATRTPAVPSADYEDALSELTGAAAKWGLQRFLMLFCARIKHLLTTEGNGPPQLNHEADSTVTDKFSEQQVVKVLCGLYRFVYMSLNAAPAPAESIPIGARIRNFYKMRNQIYVDLLSWQAEHATEIDSLEAKEVDSLLQSLAQDEADTRPKSSLPSLQLERKLMPQSSTAQPAPPRPHSLFVDGTLSAPSAPIYRAILPPI